jgi:hypothetical protein
MESTRAWLFPLQSVWPLVGSLPKLRSCTASLTSSRKRSMRLSKLWIPNSLLHSLNCRILRLRSTLHLPCGGVLTLYCSRDASFFLIGFQEGTRIAKTPDWPMLACTTSECVSSLSICFLIAAPRRQANQIWLTPLKGEAEAQSGHSHLRLPRIPAPFSIQAFPWFAFHSVARLHSYHAHCSFQRSGVSITLLGSILSGSTPTIPIARFNVRAFPIRCSAPSFQDPLPSFPCWNASSSRCLLALSASLFTLPRGEEGDVLSRNIRP